jgi:uncharacterized membrane protein YbhN (UPF0104 family)
MWLLIVGIILQLIGVIGYYFNRQKPAQPWWVPTLFIVGWVLIVIAAINFWNTDKTVLALPFVRQ